MYGPDGCQITTEAAAPIFSEINKPDVSSDVKTVDIDQSVTDGWTNYIPDGVTD